MQNLNEGELYVARLTALIEREAIVHALDCSTCGLREEALFDLALLGWTEQAFIDEAYQRGCNGA